MRVGHISVILAAISIMFASAAKGTTWRSEQGPNYCQILDDISGPVYQVGMGYISKSRFEGSSGKHGKSAFLEMDGDWAFAYFRDVIFGDVDLNFRLRSILFTDSAGKVRLPGQVAKIALDTGWTARYENGMAVQARAVPGIYSDMEEIGSDDIFIPFSLSLIRAYNPQLSGIAGFEIRPGFETSIMPLIGVEWEINDVLKLDARLPESRLVWFAHRDWTTQLGFEWHNMSFGLGDDRDQITVEDYRAYWGLTCRISDQLEFTGELGRVFERSVEFKERAADADGVDTDLDLGNAILVRFVLGGAF